MSSWPRHPAIYEINTWVWLSSIGSKIGRSVQLSSVPAAEWDTIGRFGFEAVWLMGISVIWRCWSSVLSSSALGVGGLADAPKQSTGRSSSLRRGRTTQIFY